METGSDEYATWYKVTLSFILILEMLAGVISNVVVLFSYHIDKKFNRSVGDKFITNMNIVDIIICVVSIPMSIAALLSHNTPPLFCFFHEASVLFANVASAVNVLVISLDRHDKIIHSLHRRFTTKNVRWIIPVTWVLALVGFCTPFFGIDPDGFRAANEASAVNGSRHCYVWISLSSRHFYYELYAIPVFFIASSVMIYAYYGIIQVTKVKSIHSALVRATVSMPMKDKQERELAAVNNVVDPERRVSRTTTIIISTFIVCWGPHTVISIVIVAYGKPIPIIDLFEWWLLALAYTTTLMHPILYVFMRRNFRRALAHSWFSRCLCQNRIGPHSTPSHSPARSNNAARNDHTRHKQSAVTPNVIFTANVQPNGKSDAIMPNDIPTKDTWAETKNADEDIKSAPKSSLTQPRASSAREKEKSVEKTRTRRTSWGGGTLKKIKQLEYTVGGNKDDVNPLDVENVE